jgi:phage shock protein C
MTMIPSDAPAPDEQWSVRLHRSAHDCVCCGVCGGLAEYLAVDASLVRVAFVLATLWGGIGLLLYVLLAIILPVDVYAADFRATSVARANPRPGWRDPGGTRVLVAGKQHWTRAVVDLDLFWPSVLILAGLALLLRQPHRTRM